MSLAPNSIAALTTATLLGTTGSIELDGVTTVGRFMLPLQLSAAFALMVRFAGINTCTGSACIDVLATIVIAGRGLVVEVPAAGAFSSVLMSILAEVTVIGTETVTYAGVLLDILISLFVPSVDTVSVGVVIAGG